MAIKQVPTRYETSDGREYDTQQEAERHEALITAKREYEHAQKVFGQRLAETQKTADGYPFEFTLLRDYYYITPGFHEMPALVRVGFSRWKPVQLNEADELVLTSGRLHCRIGDLYRSPRAAEEALLTAQEAWLKERTEEVEALRRKVVPAAPDAEGERE